MNLDKILEFIFRKALGIALAIGTTVIAAMCMSGCMVFDFLACSCYKVGAPMCDQICSQCSCGLCEGFFTCLGDEFLDCSKCIDSGCHKTFSCGDNTAFADCLFGDGCTTIYGDDVCVCGGANYSFVEAVCINCNFCNGVHNDLYPEADSTCSCANCTIFYGVVDRNPLLGCGGCEGTDEPPEEKRELLATVTIMNPDGTTDTVEIYDNTDYIGYDSMSGMLFKGYFSGPNGTGVQYTNGGYLIDGTYPANGATLYPYYVDLYPESSLNIRVYTYLPGSDAVKGEIISIPYEAFLSDYLPKYSNDDYKFLGWSVSTSAFEEYMISDGNSIFNQYEYFNPRNLPAGANIQNIGQGDNGKYIYEIDLYAIFRPIQYTITVYHGTAIYRQQMSAPFTLADLDIDYGGVSGQTFVGLFFDQFGQSPCDMNAPVTSDMSVYALFGKTVTIQFYNDAQDTYLYSEEYASGYTVTLPVYEKEGYVFEGWRFADTSISNTTFTTLSVIDSYQGQKMVPVLTSEEYTISYVLMGSPLNIKGSEAYYYYGETKTLFTPNLSDYGVNYYTFEGWYDNEDLTGSKVTSVGPYDKGDITLYAKLIPVPLTIYCDTGLGNIYEKTVNYGESFTLDIPSKSHYTFTGWYKGNSQVTNGAGQSVGALEVGRLGFTSQDMANGYVMLTATWEKTVYHVTFESDGNIFKTESGCFEDTVYIPTEIPTKEGHIFDGWYYGSTQIESLVITGDMTVTAKFTPKTYTVLFHLNDGTDEHFTATYDYGDTSISIRTPTRDGYNFTGWCTADGTLVITANGSGYFAFPWHVDGVELYARWSQNRQS